MTTEDEEDEEGLDLEAAKESFERASEDGYADLMTITVSVQEFPMEDLTQAYRERILRPSEN